MLMMRIIYNFLLCLQFLNIYLCQDDEIKCRDQNRLIGSEKSDYYELIETHIGEKVTLACHYCQEVENSKVHRVWYKQNVLAATNLTSFSLAKEVELGMAANSSNNRLSTDLNHNLIILEIRDEDSGIYFCHGPFGESAEMKYNYLLDIIWKSELEKIVGDETRWVSYQQQNLHPATARLPRIILPPLPLSKISRVRSLEVVNEWGTWGPCLSCDRPHGEKRRSALCRVKPAPPDQDEEFSNENELNELKVDRKKRQTSSEYNNIVNISDPHWSSIVDLYEISCRSKLLSKYIPSAYRILTDLPDFDLVEQCAGDCESEREEIIRKNKYKPVKYKKKYILQEGDHQIIMCPESNIDSTIAWLYNQRPLGVNYLNINENENPNEQKSSKKKKKEKKKPKPKKGKMKKNDTHVSLDVFQATLYLTSVTPDNEGNYTCFIDGVPMLEANVYVLSHSKIVFSELGRHALYLLIIFMFAAKCYSAGIVIACMKRDKFVKIEKGDKKARLPLLTNPSSSPD